MLYVEAVGHPPKEELLKGTRVRHMERYSASQLRGLQLQRACCCSPSQETLCFQRIKVLEDFLIHCDLSD